MQPLHDFNNLYHREEQDQSGHLFGYVFGDGAQEYWLAKLQGSLPWHWFILCLRPYWRLILPLHLLSSDKPQHGLNLEHEQDYAGK